MATSVEKISIRAYAAILKISDKAVRNAIKDGVIKKGVSYKLVTRKGVEVPMPEIDPVIADMEFGHLHKTGKVKPGQDKVKKIAEVVDGKSDKTKPPPTIDEPDGLSEEDEALISSMKIHSALPYAEATRRREIIALVLDKRKLQELEGALVRKTDVEKSMYAMGVELKKALLNLPARLTSAMRAANTEVEATNIMQIEITELLTQFSSLTELPQPVEIV